MKKKQALSQMIFFLLIFLCIMFTLYTVYQYEKCFNPSAECYATSVKNEGEQTVSVEKERVHALDEESRRGAEILQEQLGSQ